MDNLRGAALMVAAMLFFALEDMLIKLMAARLPIGQRDEGADIWIGSVWIVAVPGNNVVPNVHFFLIGADRKMTVEKFIF